MALRRVRRVRRGSSRDVSRRGRDTLPDGVLGVGLTSGGWLVGRSGDGRNGERCLSGRPKGAVTEWSRLDYVAAVVVVMQSGCDVQMTAVSVSVSTMMVALEWRDEGSALALMVQERATRQCQHRRSGPVKVQKLHH